MLNQAQMIDLNLSSDASRPMSVLVLDDNEVDRRRLLRLCDSAGLHTVGMEVSTIGEMRAALASQRFDLVFIDYFLVGEDGLDAVRLLMEDPEQSAVSIMIAGEGRMDVAIEAMRLGCSDYLTKADLTVEGLQKSVATALERQMMSYSLREERERRKKLELAVRHYARTCSVEMRSILSATLRRVRKLRSYKASEEHAAQLSDLEANIDRLWDALPDITEGSFLALADDRPDDGDGPLAVRKH